MNTAKHTATDPIADITYLNDYFYTTNMDSSRNAGQQIDLYKYDSLSNPINIFELPRMGRNIWPLQMMVVIYIFSHVIRITFSNQHHLVKFSGISPIVFPIILRILHQHLCIGVDGDLLG